MQIAQNRLVHIVLSFLGGALAFVAADWITGGLIPALSFTAGVVVTWLLIRRDIYL